MKTLAEHVNDVITDLPFIQELLEDDLINITSLARKLQPELERRTGKAVNNAAIVMAIRRRPISKVATINKRLKGFIENLGDITVRSNLVDYTFLNSKGMRDKQSELMKSIGKNHEVFYAVSQGVYETTIVIGKTFEQTIEKIFKKEKLVSVTTGLSSITIMLPKENTRISGVYYFIFQKVAERGINIVEVVSTTNEFTLIVSDEDIDKVFSILKNLKTI